MASQDLNLSDAIKIAKEAERKAAAVYADAAKKTTNPLGRSLFEELAKFEQHHYDKLTDLEKSLRDKGAFISYEGRELTFPTPGEVEKIEDVEKTSAMGIITTALDAESEAEKRYTALAEQTTDPDGQSMFKKLAEDEHNHYRILRDAYWNLNNRGIWALSRT